jgi:hypothetical protein
MLKIRKVRMMKKYAIMLGGRGEKYEEADQRI